MPEKQRVEVVSEVRIVCFKGGAGRGLRGISWCHPDMLASSDPEGISNVVNRNFMLVYVRVFKCICTCVCICVCVYLHVDFCVDWVCK